MRRTSKLCTFCCFLPLNSFFFPPANKALGFSHKDPLAFPGAGREESAVARGSHSCPQGREQDASNAEGLGGHGSHDEFDITHEVLTSLRKL